MWAGLHKGVNKGRRGSLSFANVTSQHSATENEDHAFFA